MRLLGKIVISISFGLMVVGCGGEDKESLDNASQEGVESSATTDSEAVPTESTSPTAAILTEPSEPTQNPTPEQPDTPRPTPTLTPIPEQPSTPNLSLTPTVIETPVNSLLIQLNTLSLAPESAVSDYDRSEFPHWDDEDGDGMNTRLEVLAVEKISGVGWYSRWDGVWYEGEGGLSAPSFDIDHIVSLNEAWYSGASEWDPYDRDIFADDVINLVAVSASSNRSKGARDAGEWLPSDPDGRCFLAIRVIQVKSKWELSVDQVEYEALRILIENCGSDIPQIPTPPERSSMATPSPSTPTPADLTPTPISEAPTPSSPTPTPQSSYGSSYYTTANGVDIDQYDANGNGDINCGELPSAAKPVTVLNPADDPYGLDGDGDGIGCEN